ncbi:MAG: hypothetical protein IJF55_01740 [Clostridia bacterium]|nr:hypothetical protein [Clostridia bacterium]
MRCEKCRYEQDAPFEICPSCATPVKTVQKTGTSASGTGVKKKKLSKKRRIRMIKRISLFTAALIALIVVVSLFFGNSGPKFVYPDHSCESFVNNSGVTSFIFDGEKVVEFNEDEGAIQKVEIASSGKYAVVLTNGGLLYVVNSRKCVKFDDGDNVYDFKLAAFSDTVVFLRDYDMYEGGTLLYSSLSKPSSSGKIASGVFSEGSLEFIVSPKGDAFAYVTDYEGGEWTYKVSKKGSSRAKWKKSSVYVDAISSKGSYVYYTDVNGNFTVNGKIICGPDKESAISSVIYDGNASDALVTYTGTTSDYTVLVNSGKIRDGEKQVGSLTSMVLPKEIISQDKRFYNVDSFVKTAAGITSGSDEYHYYIANKSGEFKRLFSGVLGMGEIYISTDCKTIYFRKDQQGSIKYMNLSDYNDFPKEYSFDGIEVAHFKMSKNGEYIYFINNEGTLYYKKSRSKAVKICDGVNADEYYVTDSGNVYFGTAYNGTSMELLFSKKGEKYSKVRTGTETVAIHYYEGPNVICFETQNEIYTASSGKGKLVYSK